MAAWKSCFFHQGHLEKKEKQQRTIGIIGTGRGVGVTHGSILTAGYLNGVLRRRCAILEWNDHGDFLRIGAACLDKKKLSGNCFRLLETDYYGAAGTKELLLCKNLDYQDVIVDYGTISDGNLEEFLRCDRQFIFGSCNEWQIEVFSEFLSDRKQVDKSWEMFAVFGSETTRKNIEKRLGFPIRRVPVSVDAFIVTCEIMEFYRQIL